MGVIVAAAGVIVAATVAYFTIRNLQRSYWRNLVDERDAEITELKRLAEQNLAERARFAEEQREARHALKNEVATLRAQLEVEAAKHDLSEVTLRLEMLEAGFAARTPMFEQMAAGITQQSELLTRILAALQQPDGQHEDVDPG